MKLRKNDEYINVIIIIIDVTCNNGGDNNNNDAYIDVYHSGKIVSMLKKVKVMIK